MEQWKPVLGFEAIYEVSDLSRVRRIKSDGRRAIITPKLTRSGYVSYCLWSGGLPNWRMSHRLAWEAFLGAIPPGMQINHKNGVKDDNRLGNLEVVTPSENSKHKFRVLGHAAPNNPNFGTKNGSAKLTEDQVLEIRSRYATGMELQVNLAKSFGVSQRLVSLIVRREVWGHI